MTYSMDFISELLDLFAKYDSRESLWWITGEGFGYNKPACFFVSCSDTFYWGLGDSEQITPENLSVLRKAFEDCHAAEPIVGVIYAPALFACRVRGMRPQGAAYPNEKALWPLFDAAGAVRPTDGGNPRKAPTEKDSVGNSNSDAH